MKYLEIYKDWKNNPIEFWKKNAEDVSWIKFPEKILKKKIIESQCSPYLMLLQRKIF